MPKSQGGARVPLCTLRLVSYRDVEAVLVRQQIADDTDSYEQGIEKLVRLTI